MGWITPISTHIAGDGFGFADANRIEGNLKYLREETATFNGAKTFTNNITQTAGVASLKATTIASSLTVTSIMEANSTVIDLYKSTNGTSLTLTPTERVTNGTFDTNTSGWSGFIWDAGKAIIPSVVPCEQSFTAKWKAGRKYIIEWDASDIVINYEFRIRNTAGGYELLNSYVSEGREKIIFEATVNSGNILFYTTVAGRTATIDNVTIKEMALDLNGDAYVEGDLTCGNIGLARVYASSFIQTNSFFIVDRDGSDTVGAGALFQARNISKDKTFMTQLSFDGHKDTWIYNGTNWVRQYRATKTGRHIFGPGTIDDGVHLLQIDGSASISGNINPTTTPTTGTWTVSQVIPRGMYNVKLNPNAGGSKIEQDGLTIMENYVGNLDYEQTGGAIFSDGINTTFVSVSGGTATYWKY